MSHTVRNYNKRLNPKYTCTHHAYKCRINIEDSRQNRYESFSTKSIRRFLDSIEDAKLAKTVMFANQGLSE